MAPELVRAAMDALVGRQVTDVEYLYERIGGESRPDRIPPAIRSGLADLLRLLGYRQRWVRPVGSGSMGFRWVRGPWPGDFPALCAREVESYTNFD
jgi:hypothetical protein